MFGNRKTVMAFQILAPALSKIANEYEREWELPVDVRTLAGVTTDLNSFSSKSVATSAPTNTDKSPFAFRPPSSSSHTGQAANRTNSHRARY
ncbi:hypothetical protein OUZ56_008720 [Daphnia magna]|uniref:Uncharacterized protein n=1 Tax=Daphnia magna TaxID=35525 RepID=A0ABR0ADZ4_9CRUS|nr:hypothetical protein OUZ56_008720 [Daphnia magna]